MPYQQFFLLSALTLFALAGCDSIRDAPKQNIDHAKESRANTELSSVRQMLEIEKQTKQKDPKRLSPGALPAADPWGNPYRYKLLKRGKRYELRSDGPDGEAGTDDDVVLGP